MLMVVDYLEARFPVFRSAKVLTGGGVVLIDCWLERESTPLHWLAGSGRKPPIDVTLGFGDGRLLGLEVVLQDEFVAENIAWGPHLVRGLEAVAGVPAFDRAAWGSGERYVEEARPNYVGWTSGRDLLVTWSTPPLRPAAECTVDDTLHLLLDDGNHLLGYRLLGLTDEEKAVIRQAEP